MAFTKKTYTRVFYPDYSGNFEKKMVVQNELLESQKEDMDETTGVAGRRQQRSTRS